MLSNKGLIFITCVMMAVGTVGTVAVMLKVLPAPRLTPKNPDASPFDNAFVGKDYLLTANQWIRLHAFRTVPPSVILGQQGWLYYRSEAVNAGSGHSIDDFMGKVTPAAATLMQWKQVLRERRHGLEDHGIRYLAFVAPNTTTIYPEYLPGEIKQRGAKTRLDVVMESMPDDIFDLRGTLRHHKEIEDVYDRSDTHWNDLGAFVAYVAITSKLREWFPQIRPVQRAELDSVIGLRNPEVERMIGRWCVGTPQTTTYLNARKAFDSRCSSTGEIVLAPGSIRDAAIVNGKAKNWVWEKSVCETRRFVQGNEKLPKAVVFHDSFLIALNPFLSQNFREVLYVLGRFDRAVIDKEHPDVVIDEVAERHLNRLFEI